MNNEFNVLFSNDLTNIISCESPFHKAGDDQLTHEMLKASFEEGCSPGIDVQMLQPLLGWWPCWHGKFIPVKEHVKWLSSKYPGDENCTYIKYLMNGGDYVREFIEVCRRKNVSPVISLRMNDGHHKTKSPCKFYDEHPEYRLNPESTNAFGVDRLHNWLIPGVRQYKLELLKDLTENYEIDGLELDFMRFPTLFRQIDTTEKQRCEIIAGFVREVRKILKNRKLYIRLPVKPELRRKAGFAPELLVSAGADVLNYSANFYTSQDVDFEGLRKLTPRTDICLEMTNCSAIGRCATKGEGDNFEMHQCDDNEFYTTALMAHNAGWNGIYLFNFVYFRKFGSAKKNTPVSEPPFRIIKDFKDKEFLIKQPKLCFIGQQWEDGQLPKAITTFGKWAELDINAIPDTGTKKWQLMADIENFGKSVGDWETWFNEEYIGKPEVRDTKLLWHIPAKLVRNTNHLSIRACDADISIITFISLENRIVP